MTNMMKKKPDEDVNRLGLEVERYIREDAHLSTSWVRAESKNLTRALYRGNPAAFDRWFHDYLYELLTKEG